MKQKNWVLLTTEQAEISGRFHDSLDNLKQSVTALSVSIGVRSYQPYRKMVETVQNKVLPVIKNLTHGGVIYQIVSKRQLSSYLGVLAAIGPVVSIVAKMIPMIKTLKAAMAGGEILKFFQGFSFGKVALIGLAALAVLLLQNEKFKETLKNLMEMFAKLLEPIGKLISSLANKLEPVMNLIVEVLNQVIDVIVSLIEGIMPALEAIIKLLLMCWVM